MARPDMTKYALAPKRARTAVLPEPLEPLELEADVEARITRNVIDELHESMFRLTREDVRTVFEPRWRTVEDSIRAAQDEFRPLSRQVEALDLWVGDLPDHLSRVKEELKSELPVLLEGWLQDQRPAMRRRAPGAPLRLPGDLPAPGAIEVPGLLEPFGETDFAFLYRQLQDMDADILAIGGGGAGEGDNNTFTGANEFQGGTTFEGDVTFNNPVLFTDNVAWVGGLWGVTLTVNDAVNNNVSSPAIIRHTYNAGAGTTNIGVGLDWEVESTTLGTNIWIGRTQFVAENATTGANNSRYDIRTKKANNFLTYLSVGPDTVTIPQDPLSGAATTALLKLGNGAFSGSGLGIALALAMPAGFVGDALTVQVNGTERYKLLGTGQSYQTGALSGGLVTTSSGMVNIGDGGFSGAGGEFGGSALGTYLAVASLTGFTGNVLDVQVGGRPLLRVAGTGTHSFQVRDTAASGPSTVLELRHRLSSGTALASIGSALDFANDDDAGSLQSAGSIRTECTGVASPFLTADLVFLVSNGASFPERLRIKASGTILGSGQVLMTGGFLAGATTGKAAVVDIARSVISNPTSAEHKLLRVKGAADLLVTDAFTFADIDFDLNRTVQFDGPDTIAVAYHVQVTPGTFSADAASTITQAASLFVNGPPVAGTNMTLTARYAAFFNGKVKVESSDGAVFELPADATDPTGGGGAATGRIPVRIGGALVYLPYYA